MKHNTYIKTGALALALLGAMSQPATAQTTRNITLDEAIQLSMQNNKQLKLSKAKVDEAVANTRDAWNNHLPDVKATGSYIRLNNPSIDLKVKTGNSSGGGSGSGSGESSTPTVNSAAYALVNASIPLFSGLRIHYGVESAKYLEQAAKLDADNDREEVIQNTISAYSNLYKSQTSVELVREDLKQEQQRVTDFTNLESNGLLARNDLLKAELQESNVELSLLDAENNLKITYINMDLMLGLPEDTQLVPDTTSLKNNADAGSIVQWEETALSNRKDINALSFREKAANSAIKSTKGEYYPGLALTGGYIAADIPNLLTVTNALNAGIGLQYNFGALWKTGAKVQQAKARLHEVQANQSMLADEVRVQINQAYQNYVLSQKKIDVYAKAVEQGNENYKITKNKYDNSLVTTTDLLDADVAQLQAKLNYAYAKADAAVAYKKLQQTAGILTVTNSTINK